MLSDVETAAAVRTLTIEAMPATLGELDLSRASIMLRGPDADIHHAFDVLGRTPTLLEIRKAVGDAEDVQGETAARPHHERARVTMSDVETALTDQGAPSAWTMTVSLGYMANSLVEPDERLHFECCGGYALAAEVGYRFDAHHAVGVHLGLGGTSGTYGVDASSTSLYPMSVEPVDIEGFAQATAYDRLWGTVLLGAHYDGISSSPATAAAQTTTWLGGLAIGLEGGVDLMRIGMHRLGAFMQVEGTLMSDSGYSAITIGAAYRR